MIIRLTAEELPTIYIGCRVNTKALADAIYAGLTDEPPFEILGHGNERKQLKDYRVD